MNLGGEPGEAQLDALMYRMLGGLLLLGAGVLLGLTLALFALPRIDTAEGCMLVLPGTGGRHTLHAAALPILGGGALLLGLPGLLALALAGGRARFRTVRRGVAIRPERPRAFRRPLLVLLAGTTLLVVALLRH